MTHSRTKPYIIQTIRGVQVGVIGLANDEVVHVSSACPYTRFEKASAVLTQAVRELEEQGVRHIVALTHLGYPADRELARSVDGVDVIVGGHTHTYLGPDSKEGPYPTVEHAPSGSPVLVVTAKRATQYLGELEVSFDEAGVPVSWKGGLRELVPDMPLDPQISALVAQYAASLETYRSKVVGRHDLDFADGMEACRAGECLGGMVVTDAMLEFGRPYGATIALYNSGGIRAALPRGEVTWGSLLTMMPFGGQFVVRELTGRQIGQALEHGASGENAMGPELLQAAGLRYTVDPASPVGSRVKNVVVVKAGGRSAVLDPAARYIVVLPKFLARGGDGFVVFTKAKKITSRHPLDVDILESYLSKHSPLPMPETGRIVRSR